MTTIVWFRLDLRLADNPAVRAAAARGGPIVPVFLYAPEEETPWAPGGASRWWLHHSLQAFDQRLRVHGSRLIIRRGPTLAALEKLIKDTSAEAIYWNRRYEPAMIGRDARIKTALRNLGVAVESFNAALLYEPWTVRNQSGRPFQVFTPFWKHCLAKTDPEEPLASPKHLPARQRWPDSLALEELELLPRINWAEGLRATWRPGEAGASANLKQFLNRPLQQYSEQRNYPGLPGTSRLSPHLHFGEISPRQVWRAVANQAAKHRLSLAQWRQSQFISELGWREFAHHVLFHFPHTPTEPLRAEFRNFPWRSEPDWLRAWQRGRTGYPIIDAGMRELWTTGWMHNRVRMIVGSFLVKDLLLPWQEGARWFWDTLVDADLAQNTMGWQWTAGCGADAAPYFRVFNPQNQGEKFDPHGDYIRRWCPELAKLPDRWLHQPSAAPPEALKRAGVRLHETYPSPVVNHTLAREVALEAFKRLKALKR